MLHKFPIKRLYGRRVYDLVEFSREARFFLPFDNFFAIRSQTNMANFLSIFPSETWSTTLSVLGFRAESRPVPPGAFYVPIIEDEDKTAFRLSKSLVDHLRPESDSVVVIGQIYSFELWDEKAFNRYVTNVLEEWETEGTIDTKLVMQKWHPWSVLKAKVVVEPSEGAYRTTAVLKARDTELFHFDYLTWGRYKTGRDLDRRVISLFDSFIEGATNIPDILDVHKACKIRIPGYNNPLKQPYQHSPNS